MLICSYLLPKKCDELDLEKVVPSSMAATVNEEVKCVTIEQGGSGGRKRGGLSEDYTRKKPKFMKYA